MGFVSTAWRALLAFVYPDHCPVCGSPLAFGERAICLGCLTRLPRLGWHTNPFNEIHQRLGHQVAVGRAGAWFLYRRGSEFTRIVYDFKYHGAWALAVDVGHMMAEEMKSDGFFDGVDLLLPVPLSYSKMARRGYNQAERVARGISQVTGIAIGDNLVARTHKTQTRRSLFERMANVEEIYHVENADELDGLHVMVVDDVITTGSTMSANISAIHSAAPTARISVLSVGATTRTG